MENFRHPHLYGTAHCMRRFFNITLFLFPALFLYSQKCDLYPNQQHTLIEYGVKKISVYLQPYSTGKKEVDAIYFLDTTGCAYRWINRQFHSGAYYWYVREERGSWQSGRTEKYYAQLNRDSAEVLIQKRIDYFTPAGRRYMEEVWQPENGKVYKQVHLYGPNEPDTIDRKSYTIDENGDTVRKIFNTSYPEEIFYIHLAREDGKWLEKQKWITKRDEKGATEEYRRWENGKLVEGKKYSTKKVSEFYTEVIETDLDGNPIRKTGYNDRGDYSVYEYKNGNWIFLYEELMPVADPVDDRFEDIKIDEKQLQEHGKKTLKQKDQSAKKSTQISRKKYKIPGDKPPVEKIVYRNPSTKDEVILKEIYTAEGLILETDIIRDKKKWIYEYEFFRPE
jgi:hypothetical protein